MLKYMGACCDVDRGKMKIAMFGCVVLVACSGVKTNADLLRDAVMAFHHRLLSGDYIQASSMVAPEAYNDFMVLHDPSRNITRLEDFEILSVKNDPESNKAVVLVAADTRRENSITIKRLMYRQVWQQIEGRWWLTGVELVQSGSLSPSDSLYPSR